MERISYNGESHDAANTCCERRRTLGHLATFIACECSEAEERLVSREELLALKATMYEELIDDGSRPDTRDQF